MNTTATPVRVGLVGYGFAGRTFHAPLIGAVPGLRLCAVASRHPEKVAADVPGAWVSADPLAVATSGAVDLVVVATPNDTHAPLARAAIEAGKHVVVDKPFALDLAEARGLIALAQRRKVLLSVFHNRRWDSDFLTLRNAIAQQWVGEVVHFESHIDRFRPQVRDRWREAGGPGSGLWFDIGPHLVDQALQLFGLPERVHGNLARLRTGALADDWAHVVLDYPERRVVLHAGMLAAGGTHRFTVHGREGTLVKPGADRQEAQLLAGMRPGQPGWGADPDELLVYRGQEPVRAVAATAGDQAAYYRGVLDALNGNAAQLVTAQQALGVMAVLQAAADSADAHAAVGIALTPAERASWARTP